MSDVIATGEIVSLFLMYRYRFVTLPVETTSTSCFLQANVVVASSTRKYNIIAKKIVLYRLGFGIGLNVGHWLGIVF